jgi:archaellum component FlaC
VKKLVGRTDIEDALSRLDRLTQDEVRMAAAQGLKATHLVDEKVKAIDDKARSIDNKVQAVDDTVHAVDKNVHTVRDKVQVVDDKVQGVDDKIDLVIDGVQFVFKQSPSSTQFHLYRR